MDTIELGWIGNLQWLNGVSCTVARIVAKAAIQLMLNLLQITPTSRLETKAPFPLPAMIGGVVLTQHDVIVMFFFTLSPAAMTAMGCLAPHFVRFLH